MSYTRQFIGRGAAFNAERRTICDWLRANDIAPEDVPLDAAITLDRRNMTIDVLLRRHGPKGIRHYIDPATGAPARGTITVPIQCRPPVLASLGPARRKRDPRALAVKKIADWFGVPSDLIGPARRKQSIDPADFRRKSLGTWP